MLHNKSRKNLLALVLTSVMTLCLFVSGGGTLARAKDFTTGTSSPSSVTIYTDADRTTKLDTANGSITADQTLYGTWHIDIAQADRPTADDPVIEYTFPSSSINVVNSTGGNLSVNGVHAGTWKIENNKIVITCDTDWLSTVDKDFQADIQFDFTLANQNVDEENPAKINFPGSTGDVTIPVTEKNVSAGKSCTFDAATQTITWTVSIKAESQASNLTITDTIGSNLTFNESSFALDGTAVSATVNGKTAVVNLGTVTKGEHKLTYTTSVAGVDTVAIANGKLSDVDNTANWTWGKDGKHKNTTAATSNGPDISYNMTNKSNGSLDAGGNISWTVTLNTGSLKADMAGYTFTDALDSNQEYTGSYTVTAADGTVVNGTTTSDAGSFTYTFPEGAGKQSYTITYTTKLKDGVSSKMTVENTATLKNGDTTLGESKGTYTGEDTSTYIKKELVSSASDTTNGKATWKSTINFSEMLEQPKSATFTDTFMKQTSWGAYANENVTFSDISVSAVGGTVTLTETEHYVVTNAGNSASFTITFTESGLKKLFETSTPTNVEVTYSTQLPEGSYAGSFRNTSNIYADKINKSADADYSVEGNLPMAKTTGDKDKNHKEPEWDASYTWNDGTKGAWKVYWTVFANKSSVDSWKLESDLHGASVTVTDDLAGMTFVDGSATYSLISPSETCVYDQKITPTIDSSKNTATFTVDTSTVVDSNASWHGWVAIYYQTAIKATDIAAGGSVEFTNNASADSDALDFDGTSSKVTITNNVVSKASKYNDNDAVVDYTVNVNQAALDLDATSDTLTLTDIISATGTFQPSSFKVTDAEGNELAAGTYSVSAENITEDGEVKTKLTITVPDSQALVVSYAVKPVGTIGDTVTVNNKAELSGYANNAASNSIAAKVANAKGSITAASDVIQVTKFAQNDISKKLSGAEFTLYKVVLDATNGTYTLEKDRAATTNDDGVAQFGTSNTDPLKSDVLYCIKETKAPSGYKKSDVVYYVVLRAANDTDVYNQIVADAKTCGITESLSTSNTYTYYDENSDIKEATCDINISKTVNGANPQDDEQFTFEISAKTADAPMPTNTAVTTKGAATAAFEGLTFTVAGEYEYTIHETTKTSEGDGWTNAGDITAKVTVTADSEGNLTAAVDYTGSASKDSFVFNNLYAPKAADVTFKINKNVIGDNAKEDEQFKFELFDQDGKSLGEVTCKGGETKSWDTVKFTKAGTYDYTIKETSDLGEGWTNKTGDVTAKITVTDDRKGALTATVEYTSHLDDDATTALITNEYKAPSEKSATTTIDICKTVNGANPRDDEHFTFELLDEDGKRVSGTNEVTTDGDGKASWNLTYNEAGEHTYTIHETSVDGNGWTNAADFTVTVKVTADSEGNLTATTTYGDTGKNAAFIDNKYEATPADVTFKINKNVIGDNAKEDEQFKFELFDQDGKSLGEVTCKGGETKSWDTVKFTKAGVYTYTIKETSDLGEGWTNKTGYVTAKITVTDDRKGTLTATVEYSSHLDNDTTVALITNEYKAPKDNEKPKDEGKKDEKKSENKKNEKALAQTGDNTPMTLMAGLGAAGIIAIATSLELNRRNSKR